MPVINLRLGWVFPEPADPMPDDEFESRTKLVRQGALAACDYRMLPDVSGDPAPWIAYRAELRDGAAILATRDGDLVTLPDPPEEG